MQYFYFLLFIIILFQFLLYFHIERVLENNGIKSKRYNLIKQIKLYWNLCKERKKQPIFLYILAANTILIIVGMIIEP